MFDRYYQAQRKNRDGIGLGLSIARGIVEAHGGRIWVESEEGEGTARLLHLPRPRLPTRPSTKPGCFRTRIRAERDGRTYAGGEPYNPGADQPIPDAKNLRDGPARRRLDRVPSNIARLTEHDHEDDRTARAMDRKRTRRRRQDRRSCQRRARERESAVRRRAVLPVPERSRQRRSGVAPLSSRPARTPRATARRGAWCRPTTFQRSIFAGRPAVPPRRAVRQPHLGPPAVRARAAAGRGLPRARPPVRRSRSAGAGQAHARPDRARGLRPRRRRTSTWCSAARTSPAPTGRRCAISSSCCARPTAAPSASSSPTSTTSSCATGCRRGWRRTRNRLTLTPRRSAAVCSSR